MFEISDVDFLKTVIKVVGVGGSGGNIVDYMNKQDVNNVEFICINTDEQALLKNSVTNKLQIGKVVTKGMGAGAKPAIGREAALEDRDRIAEMIEGADMLFITAGMGGGTGTGAAPIIAEVAKEMGILTVAVVTKPFAFEGKRTIVAKEGLEELSQYVDSLIVIPNEKLMEVLGEDVPFLEAFRAANDVIAKSIISITNLLFLPGLIGVDFADIRSVMSEMGMVMIGLAEASGDNRARIATKKALASPFLEGFDMANARSVLVNITTDHSFKMKEYYAVLDTVKNIASDGTAIIVGHCLKEESDDFMNISIFFCNEKENTIGTRDASINFQEKYLKNNNIKIITPEGASDHDVAQLVLHLSNFYRSIAGDDLIVKSVNHLPPNLGENKIPDDIKKAS